MSNVGLTQASRFRGSLALVLAAALAASGCNTGGGGSKGGAAPVGGTSGGSSAQGGTVTPVSGLATARSGHTATKLSDGTVLIVGGLSGGNAVTNTAELYDPATGRWSSVGNLGQARMNHAAVQSPTGDVIILGGQSDANGDSPLASIEIYSKANKTFRTSTARLSRAKTLIAAAGIVENQTFFVAVAGGTTGAGAQKASVREIEIYNADGDRMDARQPQMFLNRFNGRIAKLGASDLLIAGGRTNLVAGNMANTVTAGFEGLSANPTIALGAAGNFAKANRSDFALEMIGGAAFAFGGIEAQGASTLAIDSVEFYDAAQRKFVEVTARMSARSHHTATAFLNGREALIAGGQSSGQLVAQCQIMSAAGAGSTFAAAGNLTTPRKNHTATLLNSGNVLIVGGQDAQNQALASCEAYVIPGGQMPGSGGSGTTGQDPEIILITPTQGAVGARVTIQGRNFAPALNDNIVKVNGTRANAVRVSTTSAVHFIEVDVAAGTTTGPVTIEVLGRVSTRTNPTFTVTGGNNGGGGNGNPPAGSPTILFVIPSSLGKFWPCSITGTNFNQNAIVWFDRVPSMTIISFNTPNLPFIGQVSELVTLTPMNAQTGPLTIEDQWGRRSNAFPVVIR